MELQTVLCYRYTCGHDFYHVIFKIKRKMFIARGSALPPPQSSQWKILGSLLVTLHEPLSFAHKILFFPFGVTVRIRAEQLRSVWLSDTHCSLRVKSWILSVMRCGLVFTEFVARCHPSQFEADELMLGSSACCSALNIDECLASGWIIYHNRHDTWAPLFHVAWRLHPKLHPVLAAVF